MPELSAIPPITSKRRGPARKEFAFGLKKMASLRRRALLQRVQNLNKGDKIRQVVRCAVNDSVTTHPD